MFLRTRWTSGLNSRFRKRIRFITLGILHWQMEVSLNKQVMKVLTPSALLFVAGVLLYMRFKSPSLSIGELRWVYLGDNVSVIRAQGKDLVGPGNIELHVSSNFVYGCFSHANDFVGRWFAIKRDTHETHVSEKPEEIERMFRLYNADESMWSNSSGTFYKTFQSLREASICK